MADFPSIAPTARELTLGQFPFKTYRALSGAVLRRSFGNKAFGHTLSLQFENVGEDVVAAIIDHYEGQGGGTLGFALPTIIFAGYSSTILSKLQNPSGIEWLYAEPPSIESILRNRSTVSVSLVGEIRR